MKGNAFCIDGLEKGVAVNEDGPGKGVVLCILVLQRVTFSY